MNKYFSLNIHQLCKSVQCVPFNEIILTENPAFYFSSDQLEQYANTALTSRETYERVKNKDFINSNEIEMFKDLKVSSGLPMNGKSTEQVTNLNEEKTVDSGSMDDWLDDLLN